jgi:hypothetical protein
MAKKNKKTIDDVQAAAGKSPKHQKRVDILNKANRPEYQQLMSQIDAGIGGLTSIFGMAEGIDQKRQAKRALSQLQKPNIPGRQVVDPAMARISTRLENIGLSPERQGALGAYKGEIAQAYQGGVDAARTASGGQSGLYGSQAQALYNQRLQSAQQIPGIVSQIQTGALGAAGDLAAKKAQADSYAYMNNLQRAQMQLGQYNTESKAAADLYGTGATNFANSLQYGLNAVKQPLTDLLYGLQNKSGIPEHDAQRETVNNSMNRFFTSPNVNPINLYDGSQVAGQSTPFSNFSYYRPPMGSAGGNAGGGADTNTSSRQEEMVSPTGEAPGADIRKRGFAGDFELSTPFQQSPRSLTELEWAQKQYRSLIPNRPYQQPALGNQAPQPQPYQQALAPSYQLQNDPNYDHMTREIGQRIIPQGVTPEKLKSPKKAPAPNVLPPSQLGQNVFGGGYEGFGIKIENPFRK